MNDSYLVKILLMIYDYKTKKELHSEVVAVTFICRESKHIRGQYPLYHWGHADIEYYLRSNTRFHVEQEQRPNSAIFFTNRQIERFEELVIKLSKFELGYDSCVLEEINADALKVKEEVRELRNGDSSIIWLGEFV